MQFKVLAVATSAFALAACGGEKKAAEGAAPDAAAPAASEPAAAAPAAAAPAGALAAMPITGTTHTVNMIGDEKGYRFEPAAITVKAGDGIKFVNVKGGPHNVAFDPATAGASAAQITANMPESSGDLTGKMLVTDGEAWTMSFGGVAAGDVHGHLHPASGDEHDHEGYGPVSSSLAVTMRRSTSVERRIVHACARIPW